MRAYGTCAVCGRQRTASLKTRKIGNHNSAPRTPCPGREVSRIDLYLSIHLPEWLTAEQREGYINEAVDDLKKAAHELKY